MSISRRSREFQDVFDKLLADLAKDAPSGGLSLSERLRDPLLTREFSKRLSAFTEIWGENYPTNTERIAEAQAGIQQWIADISRPAPVSREHESQGDQTDVWRLMRPGLVVAAIAGGLSGALSAFLVQDSGKNGPRNAGAERSRAGWGRFTLGLLVGVVITYFLMDEQRRDDLLGRLAGAGTPTEQTTSTGYNQVASAEEEVTNQGPQQVGLEA